MRSIALFGLVCFITGCHCLPRPGCMQNPQAGPQTPREQTAPPAAPAAAQRVIIEVVQKPAELPGPSQLVAPQAVSPAPAAGPALTYAGSRAGIAATAGTMPAVAAGLPTGVAYQTQATPTGGLFVDVGAIADWLRAPFQWLRFVTAPQMPPPVPLIQQWPQYVQPASYAQSVVMTPQVQSFPAYVATQPQGFPAYVCPPCPPCSASMPAAGGLRAADLDELSRRIRDLRGSMSNEH